jgi:hypothetical protein
MPKAESDKFANKYYVVHQKNIKFSHAPLIFFAEFIVRAIFRLNNKRSLIHLGAFAQMLPVLSPGGMIVIMEHNSSIISTLMLQVPVLLT